MKRGGLEEARVLPLVETLDGAMSWEKDLMALNDALEQFEPRQARIVEYRYFGGYKPGSDCGPGGGGRAYGATRLESCASMAQSEDQASVGKV